MGLSGFFTRRHGAAGAAAAGRCGQCLRVHCRGPAGRAAGRLQPQRMGLLLGLYYGGTGLGIVLSALLVPAMLQAAALRTWRMAGPGPGGRWRWPALQPRRCWCGPRACCRRWRRRRQRRCWRGGSALYLACLCAGLAGYTMFGVGYIGYMTFVIALLREQGVGPGAVTLFYALAGRGGGGVVAHLGGPAGPRQGRRRAGHAEWLLGCATVLPALTGGVAAGAAVGAGVWRRCFCRWWRPPRRWCATTCRLAQWAAGISAFTIGVCGRADRGAHGRGLDCRRAWWVGARAGVFGVGAGGGGRFWPGGKSRWPERPTLPYFIRPSARMASCTAGRAPTRSR
jgi:hypothetical protein